MKRLLFLCCAFSLFSACTLRPGVVSEMTPETKTEQESSEIPQPMGTDVETIAPPEALSVLKGQVTDQQGKPLRGTLLLKMNGQEERQTAIQDGLYTFEDLPPNLEAELFFKQGQGLTQKKTFVTGQGNARLDFQELKMAPLGGYFYDVDGLLLEDVQVKIQSLDRAFLFEEQLESIGSAYLFKAVPVGVPLEITATKTGYNQGFPKKRELLLSTSPDTNTLVFLKKPKN